MNSEKIFVVIVGFDSRQFLEGCLKSVRRQRPQPEIIFVDNKSTDDSREFVKKNFPEVEIIQNKKNLGFAKATNQGIKRALKRAADYVALLNPDAEAAPNWLEILLKFAGENEKAGIIGSKIVFAAEPRILNSTGLELNLLGLSWDRDFGARDFKKNRLSEKIMAASGAALFCRAEIFKRIGFFDEKFWSFSEDLDFCLRLLSQTDYQIFYLSKAQVQHHFSAFFEKNKNLKKFLMSRNSFFIIGRHFPGKLVFSSLWQRFKYEMVDVIHAFLEKNLSDLFLEFKIFVSVLLNLSLIFPLRFKNFIFRKNKNQIVPYLVSNYQVPYHFPPMPNTLKTAGGNRLLIGINEKFLEAGFYPVEAAIPLYRWTSQKAECFLEMPKNEKVYLQMHLGVAEAQPIPEVAVFIEDQKIGCFSLKRGWQTVVAPVKVNQKFFGQLVKITLAVSKTFLPKSFLDRRQLGVMVNEISLLEENSPFLRKKVLPTRSEIVMGQDDGFLGSGWYELEKDDFFVFRWTNLCASTKIIFENLGFYELKILANSPDSGSRFMELLFNGQRIGYGLLKNGWKIYRCFFEAGTPLAEITLKINQKLAAAFQDSRDCRDLGVAVAKISLVKKD